VTRHDPYQWIGAQYKSIETSQTDGIAMLRIPVFTPQDFEDSAVEYLRKLGPVKALILDVRGNHGGSTPGALVEALMERPYRWMAESTAVTLALFRATDRIGEHTELSWSSDPQPPSPHPLYSGPLFILIDGGCLSACETMIAPFKDNHRAVILGEPTGGSTGQPYYHSFGNGMKFQLSTKREYLPDGSPFEGVGIAPDTEVHASAADLRNGNDPVMAMALKLSSQAVDNK
jgi:carboxyl-terminal processing protease